jgi:hypothetical protein
MTKTNPKTKKKKEVKTKTDKVLVLIGTPAHGFEMFGPFANPKTGKEKDAIKTAVISQRGHFGNDMGPLFVIGVDSDGCDEEGSHYVISGGIADGFTAGGPFEGDERAQVVADRDLEYQNYEIVEIK